MISLPRLLIRFRYWRAHRHHSDVFVNVWDIHRKRQMTEAEFQQQLDREGKILRRSQSVLRWQRQSGGFILIHVAVLMLVLIAFTGIVVDQGLLFVARAEAQNAADAGAHAGAVSVAFDDPLWKDPEGSARRFAELYQVLGEPVVVEVWTYQTHPEKFPSDCDDLTCIRVDVFRDVEHGNPISTWMLPVVGVTDQGVRATATAQAIEDDGVQTVRLIR